MTAHVIALVLLVGGIGFATLALTTPSRKDLRHVRIKRVEPAVNDYEGSVAASVHGARGAVRSVVSGALKAAGGYVARHACRGVRRHRKGFDYYADSLHSGLMSVWYLVSRPVGKPSGRHSPEYIQQRRLASALLEA